jgi:hypothetical protein
MLDAVLSGSFVLIHVKTEDRDSVLGWVVNGRQEKPTSLILSPNPA